MKFDKWEDEIRRKKMKENMGKMKVMVSGESSESVGSMWCVIRGQKCSCV